MQQKISAKKVWLYLFLLAVILLIVNSVFFHQKINLVVFFIFALSNIFIFALLLKFYSAKTLFIQSNVEHHQEEINLISVANKKEQ